MKHLAHILVFIFLCHWGSAQIAPNFTITDSDSIEHQLYEDYLDQGKIVVIKMFFISCPICKPFNEPFQAMYEEFGEGADSVEFLLLSTRTFDDNSEVAAYRTEYGLTFPGAGSDGGAHNATRPYREGDFGTFFGSPTFLIIAPDRTLHFETVSSGVEARLNSVREKILEIKNGGAEVVEAVDVNIEVEDYKGLSLPPYSIRLRSATNFDSSYLVPQNFTYPSFDYPALNKPEIVLEINEESNAGITTIDLVIMQRFILDLIPLDPIQVLASDVNASGNVSAADLLSMRKLILGIDDNFKTNRSYLAIDNECLTNPDACTESVSLDTALDQQNISFKVIKFGDVK